MDKYLNLYSNCIPVKGYKQSFIYDLQRPKSSNGIPNSLFDLLEQNKEDKIDEIKSTYDNKYDDTIDEYYDFLLHNGFAFELIQREKSCFPPFNLEWNSPSIITNTIIDISIFNETNFMKLINELSDLRCDAVQIRCHNKISILILEKILISFEKLRIVSLELVIKYSKEFTNVLFKEIIIKYPRIQHVIIYNSPLLIKNDSKKIFFTELNTSPNVDCGKISSNYFAVGNSTFTESQCHNTCLNRKISVDVNGYIKNCPSMKHHYGHISDTTLEEAIEKDGFKDLWFIRKDDIDVCQDCEFRHMCTDCRAFIKDPKNIKSQPAKCGYNPYMALWEGQEDWMSVEQWRAENPDWEKKALANRATYKTEDCSQYHK